MKYEAKCQETETKRDELQGKKEVRKMGYRNGKEGMITVTTLWA